jgi:hypothetical protein
MPWLRAGSVSLTVRWDALLPDLGVLVGRRSDRDSGGSDSDGWIIGVAVAVPLAVAFVVIVAAVGVAVGTARRRRSRRQLQQRLQAARNDDDL